MVINMRHSSLRLQSGPANCVGSFSSIEIPEQLYVSYSYQAPLPENRALGSCQFWAMAHSVDFDIPLLQGRWRRWSTSASCGNCATITAEIALITRPFPRTMKLPAAIFVIRTCGKFFRRWSYSRSPNHAVIFFCIDDVERTAAAFPKKR